MKNTKIALRLLIITMLLLMSSVYGFAEEGVVTGEDTVSSGKTVIREIDIILAAQECTDEELLSQGYTVEDIEVIRYFTVEGYIMERASLPRETLMSYGYTSAQINMLKAYDGSSSQANEIILFATPTCTGTYTTLSCGTTSMSIKYTWEWNVYPVFLKRDSIALAWEGINPAGAVRETILQSGSLTVAYATLAGGITTTESIALDPDHMTSMVRASFDMSKQNGGLYAKRGVLMVTLVPDGDFTFNKVNYAFTYAHATKTFDVDISISLGAAMSFTFTPTIGNGVTQEIYHTASLRSNGIWT